MAEKSKRKSKQKDAPIYRLNISYLCEKKFGTHPILGKDAKRQPNISPQLETLKNQVLELIWANQRHRGLQCYTIAWQTHQSNGLAHLDILLKYKKNIKKIPSSSFNYLLDICPQDLGYFSQKQGQKPQVHVTPYSASRINLAIIQYGQKEDPKPLTNFKPQDSTRYLTLAAIKADPYSYLSDIMDQDPYNFDLAEYVQQHNLDKQIKNWHSIKYKLLDIRAAKIARLQLSKPGIKKITRQLIQQRLDPSQLKVFDKYKVFQIIVDHINQIPTYGPSRPHKTKNIFISGPKDIGKTALAVQLGKYVGHYNLKYENKYLNRYSNHKYGFIIWNQVKFTDFSHTWILEFLEGVQVAIPMRYNACKKNDNPLIIMTSNLTLDQHISSRYKDQPDLYHHATQNLGARITHVHVPVPMFFMQKLLVSN